MAIAATYSRNIFAAVTRACRCAWFGAPTTDVEQPPIGLNNEALRVPNAAGTGYVDMIKVNASNKVEIPTATVMSGGIDQLTGSGITVPQWACGYRPVALTDGTSTQGVAKQQFLGPVNVHANCTITGVAYEIGTVGGTDYAIVSLYSNAGVLLAASTSSTTAAGGTLVGTAATLQSVPFVAAYAAKGPATYWISVQYSGTTAFIRTVPLGVAAASADNTSTLFSPLATVTIPTTFTAAKAPVACIY